MAWTKIPPENQVQMPETIMDEPAELRAWVKRSFEYAATLPKKVAKPKKKPAKRKA
jgi:hypothetical protein